MSIDIIGEARRQISICNACRYCEGYCSVFPAMTRNRTFADTDITHLANLCHNCRGCYYACQYIEPHEFDLNLPAALAEVRRESWEKFVPCSKVSEIFQRSGGAITTALILAIAILFFAVSLIPGDGDGFYAYMSHSVMVAIFLPAFVLPIIALMVGVMNYWNATGGGLVTWSALIEGLAGAARLKNLDGGHGQGCNFEKEDRFSLARKYAHHAIAYGFLACFASTSSATIMHYVFGWEAPYPLFSLPKILGLTGGTMMVVGTLWMAYLVRKSARKLDDGLASSASAWFRWLLFVVALSGLVLYAATGTKAVPLLLALHLGAVLAFFLLMPFTKMAHAPFRLVALVREAMYRQA